MNKVFDYPLFCEHLEDKLRIYVGIIDIEFDGLLGINLFQKYNRIIDLNNRNNQKI